MIKEKKKNQEKKEKSKCGVKKKTNFFINFITNTPKIGLKLLNTCLRELQFNVHNVGEEFILKNKDKCGLKKKTLSYCIQFNSSKVKIPLIQKLKSIGKKFQKK